MKKTFILTSVMSVLFACTHEIPTPSGPLPGDQGFSTECDPDTVYFQQDILPLLVSNCAMPECHDVASHEDGIILDGYENLMFGDDDNLIIPGSLGQSELFEVITEDDPDKIMPPPPNSSLSEDQINLIALWIMQGALDNSCSGCDSSQFSYAEVIAPMIQTHCIGCHSGNEPDAGLDLSTHASVVSAVSYSNLLARVSHEAGYNAMPPTGDGLSDCQVNQISQWIESGMPNN